MKLQKLETLRFDQISILEWHDGAVRGIGTQNRTVYLFILVAWDLVNARKAYVLLKLESVIADEMMRLTDVRNTQATPETWNEFNKRFDEYIHNYRGECFITLEQPIARRTLGVARIYLKSLKKLRSYRVEKTVSTSAVRFWICQLERRVVSES